MSLTWQDFIKPKSVQMTKMVRTLRESQLPWSARLFVDSISRYLAKNGRFSTKQFNTIATIYGQYVIHKKGTRYSWKEIEPLMTALNAIPQEHLNAYEHDFRANMQKQYLTSKPFSDKQLAKLKVVIKADRAPKCLVK